MEGQGEEAKRSDKVDRNPVVKAMECSICIDTVLPAALLRNLRLALILLCFGRSCQPGT
jgi:hypothetical protein